MTGALDEADVLQRVDRARHARGLRCRRQRGDARVQDGDRGAKLMRGIGEETFVPFVAGAAQMTPQSFVFYNVTGAIGWVGLCLGAGYVFGNVPIIKNNFSLVTIGIVGVSVLPVLIELLRHRKGTAPRSA